MLIEGRLRLGGRQPQWGDKPVPSDAKTAEPIDAPIDTALTTPLGDIPVGWADNLVRNLSRGSDDVAAVDVARFGSHV
ncbi:hypothetical protein [Dactylosporangium sp. CS-033363]|uniref:hypothetical protein n=1 Tax=Dactylosporangium sp. CS-033363 TaxID=3239935 RepID=UPI003D923F98